MRSHAGLRELLNKELGAKDSRVWDYLDIRAVGDFFEAFWRADFGNRVMWSSSGARDFDSHAGWQNWAASGARDLPSRRCFMCARSAFS